MTAMPKLHLRQACLADAARLTYWHTLPHLVASLGDDDWQWQQELSQVYPWRQQIMAELDGKTFGYIEIIDPARETHQYWGDCGTGLRAIDIWIGVPELLNQGYGSQMMHMALARCFAVAEVRGVLLDPLVSNDGAHRFYQRLGFVNQGERHFGDDLCYVYYLSRKDWMQ
ncbi:MAG TPA: GNAT family N-acetyltransferase [Oceanospirillaceae bacterium]|nr:GNAT family N-acetyltransferase [Oceanospirillaceae bacterium]